jgi:DNA-binding transcriptional ArsR family regulator
MDRTLSKAPSRSVGRRLPLAVLIALSVAVLGGGAIGFATAAGEDEAVFALPSPMGGDRASYHVVGGSWDDQNGYIHILPPSPLALDDGTFVSAYEVRMGEDLARASVGNVEMVSVGWDTAFVDAASGHVVATAQSTGGSAHASSGATAALGGENAQGAATRFEREWASGPVPCGTRSSLQDGGAVGSTIRVDGCGFDGPSTHPFRVERIEPVQGEAQLVAVNLDLGVRLAFERGIPYPVRYEFDIGSADTTTWTLVGFTRGEAPLVAGPVPAPVALPGVALAPADRLGPSTAGFAAPYPLADAIALAQAESQVVTDFMADHPSWFVRSASYEEGQKGEKTLGTWWIHLRGDSSEIAMTVDRPQPDDAPVPAVVHRTLEAVPASDAAPLVAGSGSGHVLVDTDPLGADDPAWPTECKPKELPSVASVANRWAVMEQRELVKANSYAFYLGCFSIMDDSLSPYAEVAAGDQLYIYPPDDGSVIPQDGSSEYSLELTRLEVLGAVEADGFRPQRESLETSEITESRQSWGALADPPADPQGTTIQRADAVWSSPPTPVAASITLLSLLAGALYWLWPTLKGGPLALFSRLQTPDLLEHPVRKELLQRIEAHPGIHYQDLVRAMGKGKGAIEHHLRKLHEGGLVKALASGGYTCWFPTKYDHRLVGAAPALKSDGARAVLAAVQARPGGSARDIGLVTGLSPAAVNHHLQRLGAAGLVHIVRAGRSLSIMPTDLAGQVGAAAGA